MPSGPQAAAGSQVKALYLRLIDDGDPASSRQRELLDLQVMYATSVETCKQLEAYTPTHMHAPHELSTHDQASLGLHSQQALSTP